jgi:SAM-dependent methyltransferase
LHDAATGKRLCDDRPALRVGRHATKLGNHSFRTTGITVISRTAPRLKRPQRWRTMTRRGPPSSTSPGDEVKLDEVEQIAIQEKSLANWSPRVDYDAIAPLYDPQAYRARTVDPKFLAFIEQRKSWDAPFLLDISCGTGNQLVANHTAAPHAEMVGVDRSLGMLRQAWPKASDIAWVQADATALPFSDLSFDFISCQFAFHHFRDKANMLRDTFRVLRASGCFVLRNLCPHESADWIYYEYFPQAEIIDLRDFRPLMPWWRLWKGSVLRQ